jgi:tetratricopeptide (TPR) repeat protein
MIPTVLRRSLLYGMLIVFFAVLGYSNTFHVPFIFDDIWSIVENPKLRELPSYFETGTLSNTRYLGFLSFALNFHVHGLEVEGYHAVNLTIHIINALLVYALVLLTMRTPWLRDRFGRSRLTSYLPLGAALLFVSHPLQSQAVTYIVQRFASLATLFYLLCLVLYIRSRLSERTTVRYALYALSVLSAVCAMKSKEISFTLPVVITLYELFFFQGSIKRRVLRLIPLYATMLIIPLSLIGIDKPLGEVIGDVSEATKVQTSMTRWEYLMTQFRVIMTYLRLVVVPIDQNLDYDYPVYRSFFDPNVVLSFLFLAALFGAALYLLYRSRQAEGTDSQSPVALYRLISFGILWFFITLSVESSLIPIVDVIFEHRMYLPSVGVFIAIGTGVVIAVEKLKERWRGAETAVTAAFMVIILLLATVTFVRNRTWKDGITLWQDVVRKSPNNEIAQYNLGVVYQEKGLTEEAIRQYLLTIGLRPNYAAAYTNLGKAYVSLGMLEKATEYFTIAITLEPGHTMAHYNLGVIYLERGSFDQAKKEFETVLRLDPYFYQARQFLDYIMKNQ